MPKERKKIHSDLKNEIKQHKATFAVYVVLRAVVIAAMVLSLLRRDFENLFVCTLSLILFLVPAFIEKNLGISLPSVLEVIILGHHATYDQRFLVRRGRVCVGGHHQSQSAYEIHLVAAVFGNRGILFLDDHRCVLGVF